MATTIDAKQPYGFAPPPSPYFSEISVCVSADERKCKLPCNPTLLFLPPRYLGNTVKLVGIGPTDIVDGNVTLTLGMIWSLIVFFMALDLGDAGDGLSVLKKR